MRKKINIILLIGILVSIITVGQVSAEFWQCFSKGELINYCNPKTPDRTCGSTNTCLYCMDSYDEQKECYNQGNYNLCNNFTPDCQHNSGTRTQMDSEPPILNMSSPLNNNIYSKRSIPLNFLLNEKSDIYYKENSYSKHRWIRLCRNCISYQRTKRFKEGLNNLTFKSSDVIGNTAYEYISFFIDSKKPRILGSYPRRGFTYGKFNVKFKESNPKSLSIVYGINNYTVNYLNISNNCYSRKEISYCDTSINLSDYEGKNIYYFFNITDITGSSYSNRPIKLKVDSTPPFLNSINYLVFRRYVLLILNVTEENLDSISYQDLFSTKKRWRRICSRLKNGLCIKKIRIKENINRFAINIIDNAGNTFTKNITLFSN